MFDIQRVSRVLPNVLRALVFAAAPLALAPGLAHAQFVCTGPGGVAGATATQPGATACGPTANAAGVNSTAVGNNAQATGESSTAEGVNSTAGGLQSTSQGFVSLASGSQSTALGGRNKATATFSTAVGWANTASGLDSFAGGAKSVASGASSMALGDAAQASANQAVALGAGASATAANSVALGSGSVASEADTVSVGASGATRRITNVADGTAFTDAATYGQLLTGLDAVSRRGDAGSAGAMAVAGLPQAVTPGKGLVGVAIGSWRGEAAFAVGEGVRRNRGGQGRRQLRQPRRRRLQCRCRLAVLTAASGARAEGSPFGSRAPGCPTLPAPARLTGRHAVQSGRRSVAMASSALANAWSTRPCSSPTPDVQFTVERLPR